MPIFEFECGAGHRFEVIDLKHEDRSDPICPVCGSTARKVVSLSTFGGFREAKESSVSRAIRRVKKADREGRLD